MSTYYYDIGSIVATPYSNKTYLNNYWNEDVYRLSIDETRSLNLSLDSTPYDNTSDVLRLYRDNNNNGVVDSSDDYLVSDEYAIDPYFCPGFTNYNYTVPAGSYLVRVFHAFGEEGYSTYRLNASATPIHSLAEEAPPNLLPNEEEVGQLFGTRTFFGRVGDTDTADTYAFSLPDSGYGIHLVNISLTELSDDADIQLVRDENQNGIVDPSEVIARSMNGGISSESMTVGLTGGDYFLQVYQYSGATGYLLTFS